MGPGLPSYQTVGSAMSTLPSTIGNLGGGGGPPSDLTPEVFDATEALKVLRELKVVTAANDEWVQKNVPPADIIAEANARLANPDTETEARKALLNVRKSPSAPDKFIPKAPPAAAPFKYATLGGTQGYNASDPYDVLGPSAAPSAAGGPMDIQSEIDALQSEYSSLTSQAGFNLDTAAQQQARDILGRIFDLRDAARKTTGAGAGGISADTAANIASQREARAQAQAQFEAQMQFDRQQAIQRIKEAQSNTLQNLMTAKQNAAQADAQFMTQNRQSIFPMGTKYAPGLEPGGAFGQLMSQLSGKPYQGEAINPQPINLKAQQDQIQSDVAALLEQMKSWGIGD